MRSIPQWLSSPAGVVLIAVASATCSGGSDLGVPEQPNPAAIVVLQGDAQRGPVGEALPSPLVVQVSDRSGHPIPGKRVSFSLPEGESGALDPLEANTDANGQASSRGTLGTTVGTWEVEASVTTLEGQLLHATIHAVGVPASPDSISAAAGEDQSAPAGEVLADSLTVRVVDRFGNPVPSVVVAWRALGGGTISAADTPTDSAGLSSVERRLGPVAGPQDAVASVNGVHGSPVSFAHTALKGTPAALSKASGDNQSAVIGRRLSNPLSVKVQDASGNPLEGVSIAWSVATGGGSVDHATSKTDSQGIGAAAWTLGLTLGPQTLTASAQGLSRVTFGATALPAGPPAAMSITTQPSASTPSGQVFSVQPTLAVTDADQNPVDGAQVGVSIESGGGTLGGTTQTLAQKGVARFTDLSISGAPGSRTLRFTAGAASAVSASISITTTPQGDLGVWTAPFDWPVVAVHLHLLRGGQVLSFGPKRTPIVWDISSGTFTEVPSTTQVFCSGHAPLPDGRLLVTGGHILHDHGLPDVNIFDPASRSWTAVAPMAQGRWYPSTTVLANGDMLTVGGADSSAAMVTVPEVWNGSSWHRLIGANLELPYYPWLFQAPNGKVFYAGHAKATYYLDTQGDGAWTFLGNSNYGEREFGSAVMYEPGKVLIVGGGGFNSSPLPTNTAETIDLTSPAPAWQYTGSMAFRRRHVTATLLPTGEVLVTGGTAGPGMNDVPGSVHQAEIWNPATGTWKTLAANAIDRIYHSTALLLPDARVLVAGSGERATNTDEFDAEIFSPPYLFRGSRPTLSDAPASLSYGGAFSVGTPDAGSIAKVTLVRPGSVTHAINMSQRFISLSFQSSASSLTVTAPANGNLAPPGDYLLFLVNADGVPSVGRFVNLR